MFRKATLNDLDRIEQIYNDIHTREEAGLSTVGWVRGIYPTRAFAEASITRGDMFVQINEEGNIVATGLMNQTQMPEYAVVDWQDDALPEEVMVLHTLCVAPEADGKGYGSAFMKYYEEYALAHGCRYLRIDTNERNARARSIYAGIGYREAGVVPCVFNGIEGVRLVCLEKKLKSVE